MIHRKQILFSTKKIGVLSILFILMFFLSNKIYAQKQQLQLNDLKKMAIKFKEQKQYFISYLYFFSFFNLSNNRNDKLEAGLNALDIAILNQKFAEAKNIVAILWEEYPNLKNLLMYKYGINLLTAGNFTESDIYLRQINASQDENLQNKILFLRSYLKLNMNEPQKSKELLNKISRIFPYKSEVVAIEKELSNTSKIKKKHKIISVPLSILLPGAGQAYCGFYFDAIQDFGFNLILGYAAYASWKYEFQLKRENRNYILPVLSTVVFSIFYLTNIYNSINSVDRTNLFYKNEFFRNVLNRYEIVLKNKEYFLNIKFVI